MGECVGGYEMKRMGVRDTDTITLHPIDSADLNTLSQNDTKKG